MSEYEVHDTTGVFWGKFVSMWFAGDNLMVTFEVTGVGTGHIDNIDIGDHWSIVTQNIVSIRRIEK